MARRNVELSVIIPVFEQVAQLRECLLCLTRPDGVEIVVVDNGSAPAQSPIQLSDAFRHVRFLSQPKPGSYAARNLGVRESTGRTLAFIDADCRARPDWIANGLAAFNPHRHPLVAGAVIPLLPPNPTLVQRFDARFGVPQSQLVARAKAAATANLWMTRELWQQANGFREDLLSGADVDFCQRTLPPVYDEKIAVDHVVRDSLASWRIKSRRMAAPDLERRGYPGILYDLLPPVRIALKEGLPMAGLMWLTRLWSAQEKCRLLAGARPERR